MKHPRKLLTDVKLERMLAEKAAGSPTASRQRSTPEAGMTDDSLHYLACYKCVATRRINDCTNL